MLLSGQSYRDYSSSDHHNVYFLVQHNGCAGFRVGVGVGKARRGGESGGAGGNIESILWLLPSI